MEKTHMKPHTSTYIWATLPRQLQKINLPLCYITWKVIHGRLLWQCYYTTKFHDWFLFRAWKTMLWNSKVFTGFPWQWEPWITKYTIDMCFCNVHISQQLQTFLPKFPNRHYLDKLITYRECKWLLSHLENLITAFLNLKNNFSVSIGW